MESFLLHAFVGGPDGHGVRISQVSEPKILEDLVVGLSDPSRQMEIERFFLGPRVDIERLARALAGVFKLMMEQLTAGVSIKDIQLDMTQVAGILAEGTIQELPVHAIALLMSATVSTPR